MRINGDPVIYFILDFYASIIIFILFHVGQVVNCV